MNQTSRQRPSPATVKRLAQKIERVGIKIAAKASAPSRREIPDDALSICVGRLHYGWIIDRGGGRWEAIKADHVSLGLYNDHGAATSALLMIGGAA